MIRFLVQLLGLSIVLTAITLILMAFKGVMRKKITAYCRYMLWLIVILRMCVPISIAVLPPLINVSVSEQFQNEVNPDLSNGKNNAFSEETVSSVNNIAPEVNTNKTDNADTTILPSATNSLNVNGTVNRPVEPSENAGRLNEGTDKRGFTVSLKSVVYSAFCIWLLGTVFCLFVELKDYSSFLKELKGSAVKAEGNIQALYDSLCESFEIKNAPKLFVLKDVTSPMLVGYIRPVIVLPEITLDDSAWEGVILHELTHYKRKDLWVKLCAVVAKSIHWFNPAAHIAVQLLNEEMELSCDEKTLYGMNEERRVQYGDVMIKILKNCKNKQNAFSTHFNPSVKTAKGRILNILDSSKKKRGISLIVFCLFVCLLAGTVFGCTKVDSNKNTGEETQKINVTNNPDKIYHVISWEREKSTLETIEGFDIDESWKKMAKAFLTKDVATIEELAGVKKGMYEKFKNFEFGDFYVNLDPNNKYLFISVFIKDAKGVEVKSGDYASFMVGQGVNGVSLSIPHLHGGEFFDKHKEFYQETDFLEYWLSTPDYNFELKKAGEVSAEEMSEYSVSLYDFLYCYFKKIMTKDGQEPLSDSSLADMCKQYATDVFGLTDHSGFDKVFAVREGQISYVHRHGGELTSYVVTDRKLFDENGGIIEFGDEDYDNYASCEIYAQFYADPGYFMKSHLVKYTFTHGEIAPENFSYEIVESSEYEPYFQMR